MDTKPVSPPQSPAVTRRLGSLTGLLIALAGCAEDPTAPEAVSSAARRPQALITPHATPCVPEVTTTNTDSTEIIWTSFSNTCSVGTPDLSAWGIEVYDPIAADNIQGDLYWRFQSNSNFINMPSPPWVLYPGNQSLGRQIIEFSPPVRKVEFLYSRLKGERAVWNGQIVAADSLRVRAYGGPDNTAKWDATSPKVLYSNVATTTPPWNVWTPVTFEASGDVISWLSFEGSLTLDDLRITRAPLSCTSPVQRNRTVRCTVVRGDFRVSRWEFVPDSAFAGDTVTWAADSAVWEGAAVVSGKVRVYLTKEMEAKSYTRALTVVARPWQWASRWTYTQGELEVVPSHEPTASSDVVGRNCPYYVVSGTARELCTGPRLQPDIDAAASDTGYGLRHVTRGPNTGYWFVDTATWEMRQAVNLNRGRLPTSPFTHPVPSPSNKCKQALGYGAKATNVVANYYNYNAGCLNADMAAYIAAAWGHELFGANGGRGHEGVARGVAGEAKNDPYLQIESMSASDSAELGRRVRAMVNQIKDDITTRGGDANHALVNGNYLGNYVQALWDQAAIRWQQYTFPNGF